MTLACGHTNVWQCMKSCNTWDNIKKENMEKRERFLKAGGSFDTIKSTALPIDLYSQGAKFRCEYKATDGNLEIIFEKMPNGTLRIDKVNIVKEASKEKPNSDNIIANTKPDTWVASRGREIKIVDLADKHLVNIMRFLVAHWREICKHIIIYVDKYYSESDCKEIGVIEKVIKAKKVLANSADKPSDLLGLVVPFEALTLEVIKRFGYDALNALYEGK